MVSTREFSVVVFVPGLSELSMYLTISDLDMEPFPPRGALALFSIPVNQRSAGIVEVSTPYGAASTGEITVFFPAVVRVVGP